MKAADLMIGDKVMVKVLSQIPDTYVLHTWTANDYSRDLQIKPIPLTAEILEKNGFILHRKTYILKWRGVEIHWRKTDGYASITAPNNLKLEGWCSISNGYFCYVHILQHALRLCGLDELADNFKI